MKKLLALLLLSPLVSGEENLPMCEGDKSEFQNCKYNYSDSTWYAGEWVNGNPKGSGTISYKTSDIKCTTNGTMSNGSMSGYAKKVCNYLKTGVSTEYIGNLKTFTEHGYGERTYSNGLIYKGEFIEGEITQGTYINDGYKYSGEFKNNKRHGIGTAYFESGDIYQGNFKDDLQNGKGLCKLSDFTMSEIKNGIREQPSYLAKGQTIYECEFENNKLVSAKKSGSWFSKFVQDVSKSMVETAVTGYLDGLILGTFTEPCIPEVKTKTKQVVPGNSKYGTKTKTSVKFCNSPYQFK